MNVVLITIEQCWGNFEEHPSKNAYSYPFTYAQKAGWQKRVDMVNSREFQIKERICQKNLELYWLQEVGVMVVGRMSIPVGAPLLADLLNNAVEEVEAVVSQGWPTDWGHF